MEFLTATLENLVGEIIFALLAALMAGLWLRGKQQTDVLRGQMTASPDSKHAAYESGGEIFVNDKKHGLINVTRHPALDRDPLWSRDSRLLAFRSQRGGDWNVWVVDTQTGGLAQITTIVGIERPLAWAEDGSLLIGTEVGTEFMVAREEVERWLKK